MKREIFKEPKYVDELLAIIRSDISAQEMQDRFSDYHENDIAGALEQLTPQERKKVYLVLGAEKVAEVFTYIEDVDQYLKELSLENAAMIISQMDSDDAVDVLEEIDETTREKIVGMMDRESGRDIRLIWSYDDDEIGSRMTTNFIVIRNDLSIRQATRELIRQAGENDNITVIYVVDEQNDFYGVIDLKDLIIAREYMDIQDLITTSYPYVTEHEKISDCIERIKDYAEDSIPVLSDNGKILGIITA